MAEPQYEYVSGGEKLQALLDKHKAAKDADVEVGIFNTATYAPVHLGRNPGVRARKRKAIPAATVFAWNEFGTKRMPERPAFRNTIARMRGANGVRAQVKKLLDTHSVTMPPNGYEALGAWAQGELQTEIVNLRYPPNSPVTVKMKGSSNPLIDTGFMRLSVTWRVK